MVLIIFCLTIFLVTVFYVSERWGTTFGGAILVLTKSILFWIKQMIPKKEVYYPTGIGYDCNGCFCPDAVEKEFSSLEDTLDGLYLYNHTYNNELFGYKFKYARVKNDIVEHELYDYIDKKVLSIVHQYLHRIGNNRATDSIASITLESTMLTVYIARTQKGEQLNRDWKFRQRTSIFLKRSEEKKPRGPIVISWEKA